MVTFSQDYKSIENAYRSFALAPKRPTAQEERLQKASAQLTVLRKRVQRIHAPPKGRALKQV